MAGRGTRLSHCAFVGSRPTDRTKFFKGGCMSTPKETLDKAYGNMPKEVGFAFSLDWVPTQRGIKYYWQLLVRKITR